MNYKLPKRIVVGVIRCFELQIHQINRSKGRSQKENFHHCIIQ